jgi:hypothetical protein
MRLLVGSIVFLSHTTWGMKLLFPKSKMVKTVVTPEIIDRYKPQIVAALDPYTREGYSLAPQVKWFEQVVDETNGKAGAVWMHHKDSTAISLEGEPTRVKAVIDTFGGIYAVKVFKTSEGRKRKICIIKRPCDFSIDILFAKFLDKKDVASYRYRYDLSPKRFISQKIDKVRYDDVCAGPGLIAAAKKGVIEIYDASVENGPVIKKIESSHYNHISDMLFVSEEAKHYFFAVADHVLSGGPTRKVTDKKALVHGALSREFISGCTFEPIYHDAHTVYDRLKAVKSEGVLPSYVSLVRYANGGETPCEVEKRYGFAGDRLSSENLVYKKRDGVMISLAIFRHLPELHAWTRSQPFHAAMSTEIEGMGRGSQVYSDLFSENMETVVHALCNVKSSKDIEARFQGMSQDALAEVFGVINLCHWRANIRDTNTSNWVDLQKHCIEWIDRQEEPLAVATVKGHTVSLTPLGSLVVQSPKPWLPWNKTSETFYRPVMHKEHKDAINNILESSHEGRFLKLKNYFTALRHVNNNAKICTSGIVAAALYRFPHSTHGKNFIFMGYLYAKKSEGPKMIPRKKELPEATTSPIAQGEVESIAYDSGCFTATVVHRTMTAQGKQLQAAGKWYQNLADNGENRFIDISSASETVAGIKPSEWPMRSFITADHKPGEYLRPVGWGSWLGYLFYPRVSIIEPKKDYIITKTRVFNVSDMWGRIKDLGKIALGLR